MLIVLICCLGLTFTSLCNLWDFLFLFANGFLINFLSTSVEQSPFGKRFNSLAWGDSAILQNSMAMSSYCAATNRPFSCLAFRKQAKIHSAWLLVRPWVQFWELQQVLQIVNTSEDRKQSLKQNQFLILIFEEINREFFFSKKYDFFPNKSILKVF